MKQIKIYSLKDPITLEVKYIGKTSTELNIRLLGHIHEAYHRKRLQFNDKNEWIKSLFDIYKMPIINLIEEVDEIDSKYFEKYWINYYSINSQLFNVTFNNQNLIKREDLRRIIFQYDLNGNFIREWESILKVEQELNISGSNVTRAAGTGKFKRKEAGGYMWRFYKTDNIPAYKKDIYSKPVYQYDLNGLYLSEYESAREASLSGFSYKNVSQCCLGEKKSHKGYQWSFDKVSNIGIYSGTIRYKLKQLIEDSRYSPNL